MGAPARAQHRGAGNVATRTTAVKSFDQHPRSSRTASTAKVSVARPRENENRNRLWPIGAVRREAVARLASRKCYGVR